MSMSGTRIVFAGLTGKTGSAVLRALLRTDQVELVGAVARDSAGQDAGLCLGMEPLSIPIDIDIETALDRSRPQALVDFTAPDAATRHIEKALERGVPCVVGTTGVPQTTLERLGREAETRGIALMSIANFSIGAMLLLRFAREAAKYLDSAEIIERHHATKLDAPSGTAIRLAEAVTGASSKDRIPIHSVRLPGLVAHHEIMFGHRGETLTIRHDTQSRESFAPGVLMALQAVDRFQGLITNFEAVFESHIQAVNQ